MTDEIVKPKSILSLDEARAAIAGKKAAAFEGVGGMKRNADKEFVLTTSLTVATGLAERVYNLMSEQQAEGLAKVEFMCQQHVEQLRQEIESRTLRGRWRRLVAWVKAYHANHWNDARSSLYIGEPDGKADYFAQVSTLRQPGSIITGLTESPEDVV